MTRCWQKECWPSCSSTSTTSRRSTTTSATTPATSCSVRSVPASTTRSAPLMSSYASAATSSPSCSSMLMPPTPPSVAERILADLREPFVLDVMNASIGASIGIAFAPADARDTTALLRCADAAMYRGKLQEDSIETYNLQLDDDGNLLRLAEELRLAIEKKQFVVHYQPQLDLRTGEIAGVEALLRWAHPRLGLVPPVKFISIAEEAGLMPSSDGARPGGVPRPVRRLAGGRRRDHRGDQCVSLEPPRGGLHGSSSATSWTVTGCRRPPSCSRSPRPASSRTMNDQEPSSRSCTTLASSSR